MKSFSVPGPAWVGLLGLLAVWLNQYFGDFAWAATAVMVITTIGKIIEMNFVKPPPQPEPPPGVASDASYMPVKKPNTIVRFLVGS